MAQFFKQDDIEEFKECYDLNNSNQNIVNERFLRLTMRSLGFSPTADESMKYWRKNSTDRGIDFATFLNILHDHSKSEDCENEIIAAFAAQDRKRNGTISSKDFRAIMCNSGEKVDPKLVDSVLREAGQTGSVIRYAEVVKTLLNPAPDY